MVPLVIKRLDRYVFREIAWLFLASLAVLTVVLGLAQLLQLTQLVINKGIPLSSVFLLQLYLAPSFLAVTLPMAQLVAIVMGFSRLASDLEITALRASGVSLARLLRPMAFFSLVVFAITAFFIIYALPRSNHAFRSHLFTVLRTKTNVELRERVFNDYFPGVMLYVDEVRRAGTLLRGVLISDTRNPNSPQTITAHEGMLLADPKELRVFLRLKEGSIHSWIGLKERYDLLSFSIYDLTLSLGEKLAAPLRKRTRELTLGELAAHIRDLEKQGKPAHRLRISLQQKFSLPFACLLLGFVGAPLGMLNRRSGRFGGMVVSLSVILVYYLLLSAGEALGGEGVVPPVVAVWAPNLFLGVVGSFLVAHIVRGKPFQGLTGVSAAVGLLVSRLLSKPAFRKERRGGKR